ncbi:class I adenylate-forming enzyme family protein [Nocardia flavorosea]|uniref:Acyl--CoA ligase n=1 Tax=Nocardia flavorosea TaxID=53429 RepID=A0A846YSH6_9NOCA|nr:class I adenylate-forming enzyme family protein [Nocardia flavorosea]NKY60500.1 acyl--CoA ligase [Nocardia flavorosea]
MNSVSSHSRDGRAGTGPALVETSVGARFAETARRRGNATALLWEQDGKVHRLDFATMLDRVESTAARLQQLADPGDRVALWAANSVDWILAEYGAAAAGMALVPMNPALTRAEAAHIVTDAGARVVLAGPPWRGHNLLESAEALTITPPPAVLPIEAVTRGDRITPSALPDVPPEAVLRIQYTSGTTGAPKGAVLTHLIGANVGPLSHLAMGLDEDEIVCSPLPFHHVGGSVCTSSAALLRGSAFVVLPSFDPAGTLALLRRAEVTYFGGVPTMFISMLEACGDSPDLPRLKWMMLGGSDSAPELISRVERAFGVEILNGYGQSEAPSSLQTNAGDPAWVKAATIGRVNPHREIRIADIGTGQSLGPGETGELCLRGRLTMSRYWHEDETQRSAAVDEEGWLHTGDLAEMDADGIVRLRGRLRELIIRGGENIYPAEVEAALIQHPAVAEAAVVAAPDEKWGQVPVAFIRPVATAPDPAALEEFARERLAGFKVPRAWHIVDTFPLTPSGKVRKVLLAQQLLDKDR